MAKKLGKNYRIVCVSNVYETPTIGEVRDPIEQIAAGKIKLSAATSIIEL
jgi:hypothetical protein